MTISTLDTSLKPIETCYRGNRFKSRLEARWAVFFDLLGLRWEYEVEGYELPDKVRYLPDFKLFSPQGNHRWVEIKPSDVTDDPKFKAFKTAIAKLGGTHAQLVSGSPLQWLDKRYSLCPRCGVPTPNLFPLFGDSYCSPCDMETPSGGDNAWEFNGLQGIPWRPHKGNIITEIKNGCLLKRLAYRAATTAQGARFEFGEQRHEFKEQSFQSNEQWVGVR